MNALQWSLTGFAVVLWILAERDNFKLRRKVEKQPEGTAASTALKCRCGADATVWRKLDGHLCPACSRKPLCEICCRVSSGTRATFVDGEAKEIELCGRCLREDLQLEAAMKGGAA